MKTCGYNTALQGHIWTNTEEEIVVINPTLHPFFVPFPTPPDWNYK